MCWFGTGWSVGKSINLGRRPAAIRVTVAERADPQVVAAREPLIMPAEPVPSDGVVAAARDKVDHIGLSGLGPGLDVVKVTFGGPTSTPSTRDPWEALLQTA